MRESTRTDDAGGVYIDTVIVEAAAQDMIAPRSMPNASLNYLAELLHMVAPDPTRMVASPMCSVHRVSHVGMMVNSVQASCVLSLVAHVGRSDTVNLEGGHKLISRGCWNVPFGPPQAKADGAPEHADVKISGEVASYCTMETVQDYTLTARRATEPMYALIVISSVRKVPQSENAHVYMVEKVHPVCSTDMELLRMTLRRLARFAMTASSSTASQSTPIRWAPDRDPGHAKKARRLGAHPTDNDIPSPTS